jgi:hypothetical protein
MIMHTPEHGKPCVDPLFRISTLALTNHHLGYGSSGAAKAICETCLKTTKGRFVVLETLGRLRLLHTTHSTKTSERQFWKRG